MTHCSAKARIFWHVVEKDACFAPMNVICVPTPLSIARFAFQFILHQALLADKHQARCGLLGVSAAKPDVLQHVLLCASEQRREAILAAWEKDDICCAGLFSFAEDVDIRHLMSGMPQPYIALLACLDEKGRLDLLAKQHVATSDSPLVIALTMTEDGQFATNV